MDRLAKKKKKGKKKGTAKTALQQKKGKLKKNKKRALEGEILFDEKSGLATGIKAAKSRNLIEKREKTALQGKKGFQIKKKRRGEKGHIKNCALRKKRARQTKKNEGLGPFF